MKPQIRRRTTEVRLQGESKGHYESVSTSQEDVIW